MARSDNREKRIRYQLSNIDSDELHGWPPPSPPSLSPRPARLRTDIESLNLQRPLTSLQERLARQEAASDLPLSPPEPSHEVFDQNTFFDTTIPLTAPLNLSLSASSSPHETHSSSGSNSPSPPPSPTRRYFERPAIRRKQPSRFPSPPATASSASPSQRNGTDAGPSTTSTAGRKAMARRSLGSIPSPRIIMQTTRSEQIRQQESFEIESESDTTEAKSDKEEKRKMVAEEANKSRISAKTTSTQKDDTPVSATNQKRRRSNSSSRRPRRVSTPTRRSTRKTRTNRNANSSGSSAQQTGSNQSRNSARHPSNRRHRQTRATRTSSTQPLRRSERIMSRNAKKATSPS